MQVQKASGSLTQGSWSCGAGAGAAAAVMARARTPNDMAKRILGVEVVDCLLVDEFNVVGCREGKTAACSA